MEVLRWSDVPTILSIETASKTWYRVCEAKELWREMAEIYGVDIDQGETTFTPKIAFKELYLAKNQCYLLCKRREWLQSWSLKTPHSRSCACVILSLSQVLFCGGGGSQVSLFSPSSNSLTPYPDMLHPRSYHSAVCLHSTVYVFGSDSPPINSTAEMMQSGQWRPLPDMLHPRGYFTACAHGNLVYLCGGFTCNCEVFDTNRLIYTSLPCSLDQIDWTVTFVYKGKLTSVVDSWIYQFEPENTVKKQTFKAALIA